jgi:hypothetical protein
VETQSSPNHPPRRLNVQWPGEHLWVIRLKVSVTDVWLM